MRLELVQCFYSSGFSASAALRSYKTKHNLVHDPCTASAISKLIKKFETEFTLHDSPKSGRTKSLLDERLNKVENAIATTSNEHGSTSLRRLSNETGISKSTIHRILKNEMHMYPYKIQMLQEIKDHDLTARLQFASWINDNEARISNVLWSDEAYFHLNGDVSRYHCRIWSLNKPTNYLTRGLHPAKICVWFGFTSKFKLEPYFFDSTVNATNYLEMLQTHVVPQLAAKRKLRSTIFMQDGAPPHFANTVKDYLTSTFSPSRVIARGCEIPWPARSPDLNPLDFWFWGTIKARVFHTNAPSTLAELREKIKEECNKITPDELASSVSSLWRRVELLEKVEGGHFQQFL